MFPHASWLTLSAAFKEAASAVTDHRQAKIRHFLLQLWWKR